MNTNTPTTGTVANARDERLFKVIAREQDPVTPEELAEEDPPQETRAEILLGAELRTATKERGRSPVHHD